MINKTTNAMFDNDGELLIYDYKYSVSANGITNYDKSITRIKVYENNNVYSYYTQAGLAPLHRRLTHSDRTIADTRITMFHFISLGLFIIGIHTFNTH
jgi:hypothetical protein